MTNTKYFMSFARENSRFQSWDERAKKLYNSLKIIKFVYAQGNKTRTSSEHHAAFADQPHLRLLPVRVVFLPAAGNRLGSNVNNVDDQGYYWSSAATGEIFAYRMRFDSDDVFPGSNSNRNYGYSVRLITESK